MIRWARALLLGLLGFALAGSASAEIVDRVAAVVNREVITLSEVYETGADFINESVGDAPANSPERRAVELVVLDALIQRQLIAQEMQRLGLDVTQDELERSLDDVARQNGLTREQLKVEVERSGLAWNAYREEFRESIRQMKFQQIILLPRVTLTEDELLDYYNRNYKLNYKGAELRALEGIFLQWPASATPEERAALAITASEARARYAAGTPWTELLDAYPQSALYTSKGKLGTFRKGEAVSEIDGPAFSMAVGDVSEPIALPTGLLILRVASAQSVPAPPFEQVKETLRNELIQSKMDQELELWTAQARRAAAVEVRLESLEPVAAP